METFFAENAQQVDLQPTERIAAVRHLAPTGLGVRQIARNTGLSAATVSRWIRIGDNTLLLRAMEDGRIDLFRAMCLAGLRAPDLLDEGDVIPTDRGGLLRSSRETAVTAASDVSPREALSRTAESDRHHPIPPPILDATVRREWEDRLAGRITDFAGSMRFVYIHTIWFGLWIMANSGLLLAVGLGIVPWDPFPYGLLTLIVSLEAIFLSTFVMISQNRQSAVADARAQADYAVNVRSEAETARLLHLIEALMAHQADLADTVRAAKANEPEPTE